MAIYPGLTVQYSADGITWKDVTSDTTVKGRIKLRTRYVGLAKRSLKMPLVGGQGTLSERAIVHFTVTGENQAGVDLVLIQTFLPYYAI